MMALFLMESHTFSFSSSNLPSWLSFLVALVELIFYHQIIILSFLKEIRVLLSGSELYFGGPTLIKK